MTDMMPQPSPAKRTARLITVAIALLAVVLILQFAVIFRRHVAPEPPAGRFFRPPAQPGLVARVRDWVSPRPPASAVTPDTVWNQAGQIERMHSQINRLFEQAFADPFGFPLAPAAASNATTSGGGAPSPLHRMDRMRQQIDALFASAVRDFEGRITGFEEGWADLAVTPGLNVRDTGAGYEVTLHIPGVDKSAIMVSMDGSILEIAVAVKTLETGHGGGSRVAWQTGYAGRFERRLRLPGAGTRPEDVKATYDGTVLKITAPKAAAAGQRHGQIAVN